jgi:hypothetical protein
MRVEFQHPYLGSDGARHERDEYADRATPNHDSFLAGLQRGAADVVYGDRGGLDQGAVGERQLRRQGNDDVGWNRPALLHRTDRVDADEGQPVADVSVPGPTCGAGAAPVQWHHGDRCADREVVNARAERGDAARHLMADRLRYLDAVVHRTVQDMQVGAADAGVCHLDLDLSGTGRDGRPIFDHDRRVAGVQR